MLIGRNSKLILPELVDAFDDALDPNLSDADFCMKFGITSREILDAVEEFGISDQGDYENLLSICRDLESERCQITIIGENAPIIGIVDRYPFSRQEQKTLKVTSKVGEIVCTLDYDQHQIRCRVNDLDLPEQGSIKLKFDLRDKKNRTTRRLKTAEVTATGEVLRVPRSQGCSITEVNPKHLSDSQYLVATVTSQTLRQHKNY